MLGSFSLTVLGCAVLVFVSFIVRGAGSNTAEDAAIRKLIHLTD
jgi:hypothetical protein